MRRWPDQAALSLRAGTAATAVLAARIPPAERIAPIDVEPDMEDAIAACQASPMSA